MARTPFHFPHNQEAIWSEAVLRSRELDPADWENITALLQDNQRAVEDWASNDSGSGSTGIRPATVTVAAVDALHPESADFQCDGVSDELTIIAALATLPGGAGRVLLSEGTFTLSDPILVANSNVTIEGAGYATVINKTSQNNVTDSPAGQAISVHGVKFQLKNLTMGSVVGGSLPYNLRFASGPGASLVTGCYFLGAGSGGIVVQAGASDGLIIANNYFETAGGAIVSTEPDILIVGNHFFGNTSIQISTTNATGCVIASNRLSGGGGGAFIIATNTDGLVICTNRCISTTPFLDLNNCRKTQVSGNVISGVVNTGAIRVAASAAIACKDNAFTDNVIFGCTGAPGSGIVLTTAGAGCDNNFISGNKITGNVGWGVDVVGAACNTNVVVGNDLRGNTAGALRDTGTGTITLYPGGANGDNFP